MSNSDKIVTWDDPPSYDDSNVPTREEVAQALKLWVDRWAIVARCDRAARAAAVVERICDGREYGTGFVAVARRVGNEHRVYARYYGGM